MTIGDIKGSAFAYKDVLTSAQLNLVRAYLQQALDGLNGGTYALASKLTLNGTGKFELGDTLRYTARSVTRRVPFVQSTKHADWTLDAGGQNWVCSGTNAVSFETPLIGVPHGATLTHVTAHFIGANGVRAGAPATLPRLQVFYRSLNDAAGTTQIGSDAFATYSSEAQFEAQQAFGLSGGSHVIDLDSNVYWVRLNAEGSTNAIAGGIYSGLTTTCTVSAQSEYN